MISSWDIECPVCNSNIWGDSECWNERIICPTCGSSLSVCAEASWDTCVEVLQECHGDEEETP